MIRWHQSFIELIKAVLFWFAIQIPDLLEEFRWDASLHPSYFPDLAPSDFLLFPAEAASWEKTRLDFFTNCAPEIRRRVSNNITL